MTVIQCPDDLILVELREFRVAVQESVISIASAILLPGLFDIVKHLRSGTAPVTS